jgi:hypothetical protein
MLQFLVSNVGDGANDSDATIRDDAENNYVSSWFVDGATSSVDMNSDVAFTGSHEIQPVRMVPEPEIVI